jgi:hypothetical protein
MHARVVMCGSAGVRECVRVCANAPVSAHAHMHAGMRMHGRASALLHMHAGMRMHGRASALLHMHAGMRMHGRASALLHTSGGVQCVRHAGMDGCGFRAWVFERAVGVLSSVGGVAAVRQGE